MRDGFAGWSSQTHSLQQRLRLQCDDCDDLNDLSYDDLQFLIGILIPNIRLTSPFNPSACDFVPAAISVVAVTDVEVSFKLVA